ncbi:hypothetical protein AVEN_128998-1 [Araneus ventricosus]|uniref:Uncharacterized protein n=1 Tax=Araneus ventricosus TaxID=182803 RepID=A0A4Y2GC75_ARAVE|nr:hypothetical protein AVEN_128998-1 [Araneus ventricosus]
MTTVFLHFSPLLHDAPCLPADSPVSPAQLLLQLINDCEPVILLLLPQRSIVLCTCLPADSPPPITVARNQSHLSHGNCINLMSVMHQDTQVVGLVAPMNCVSLQQKYRYKTKNVERMQYLILRIVGSSV